MTIQKKARMLLRGVDKVYAIPTYMEERVLREIATVLKEMEEKEKEEKSCS